MSTWLGYKLHEIEQRMQKFADNVETSFAAVKYQLDRLEQQGVDTMALIDDLNAELVEINTRTNDMAAVNAEISADIDDILAQLALGVTPAQAAVLKQKLMDANALLSQQHDALLLVAQKHTPGSTP